MLHLMSILPNVYSPTEVKFLPIAVLIGIDKMTPSMYNFQGDGVTLLGLVGIISTAIIIVTAYRRYWASPYRK